MIDLWLDDWHEIRQAVMSNALPLNPSLQQVPTYQPGRPIEEVARELGLRPNDVIKLASNENPLGPSPAAVAAMEKALQTLHLYPDGNAFYLKQKLADKLGVEPRHLILGNGSNEIIEFVGHALMQPGTDVIVSQYCFAVYPMVTRLFGANLITVPAVNYGHNLPAMLEAITPQTRVLFVANPNNPTGTLVRREDVVMLLNKVTAQVLLVMDEAYIEFLDDPVDLLPFIQRGLKANLLLMRTFSKIYGLAGLRLGYGIGHADLVAALEKVRQPFNINSLVQAGAIAALDDTEHVMRTRTNNFNGRAFLEMGLRNLGLSFIPSSANFILVKVGNGQHVFEALQNQGVITRPMGGYQLPEFIRISVGTQQENERCLRALENVLARKS
jgi:histidinol-phosphate aminotransferase